MSTGAYGAATSSGYNNGRRRCSWTVTDGGWCAAESTFADCAGMPLPRWPA